jgi:hypothetical protein
MARRKVIEVIDDTDGTVGAEEIRFGLEGAEYAIDLTNRNAEKLRRSLAPFIEAGRRTGGRRRRAAR